MWSELITQPTEGRTVQIQRIRVCINQKYDVITQDIFPSTEGEPDITMSMIINTISIHKGHYNNNIDR